MEKSVNEMTVWPSIGFRYVFFIDMKTGKKYFRVFNMGNLKKYIDGEILDIVDLQPGLRPYISRMDFYFTTDDGINTACTDFTAIYLNPDWIIRNIKLGNIPSAADFIACDIPLEETTEIFSMNNDRIDMKDPDKFAEVAKNILKPHDFGRYDSDNYNMFTIIHELYHNLLQHKKRIVDFKRHYNYPTTQEHLNIITDQEINSYLLAFCFQNSFELVDNFKGIDYRKGNPVPEMNVSQEIHNFLYNTDNVPLLDIVEDENGHPSYPDATDENGHTIMLTVNFPKQTFERYPYFDEHNLWPLELPKKKRPGKDKQIVDHGTKVLQNKGEADIYDSGYRDGYKDCVPNKELTSHEEYNNGYSDGVNAKVYDAENGSCQNDPDIIDTKSPGNATNESLKFYHRNYGKINESTDLNQDSSMDLDDSQPEDSSNHDRYNFQTIQVAPEGVDVPEGGNVIASGTPIGVGPDGISIGGKSAGAKHTGGNSTEAPKNHIENGYNGPSIHPAPNSYYNRHTLLDKNGKPVPVDAKGGGGGTPGTQPVKNGKGGVPSSIPYGGTQSSDSMDNGLSGDMLSPEESAKIRKDLGLDEPSPTAQIDWQRSIKENGFADTPLDPNSPLAKQAKENDAASKGGQGGLSNRQSGGLTEICAAVQESMKSVVNWKRVFIRYLKGAFRNPLTRINKSRLGWEDEYIEYQTSPRGGSSTGNVLFFVDKLGSISQNQLGQFFKEICSLKRQIGMVKNIFMVPFAGDNGSLKVLKASVFKNGNVQAPLKSELTGGTDFPDLRYMTKGRIVNKMNMRPLWRSEYSEDFPVVTIILTDGEINLPNLLQEYQWHRNRHKLIIFVLNRDERVRDEVKEWAGRNLGSNSFIGISTDDFV